MATTPKLDARTPEHFAALVRKLLARSVPGGWPDAPVRGDAGQALIEAFAQMCGVVVDRLHEAPRKNFLAFLNMQGVALRPPQSARVPLTFHLSEQYAGQVTIPARTQVAAKLDKNEKDPVVFETEREFVATSAKLLFVGTKDGTQDTYADYSAVLEKGSEYGIEIFHGTAGIEHLLYIDLNLVLPPAALKELRLSLDITPPDKPSSAPWWRWEIRRDSDTIPVTPSEDQTVGLSKTGAIVFRGLPALPITNLPTSDAGLKGQWLICRLTLPLANGPGLLAPANLPSLKGVDAEAEFARNALQPDSAFFNQTRLDTTKDFFPFGEHPKFGDTFYLAGREAFSFTDAAVTVQFVLANPEQEGPEMRLPPAQGYGLKLLWELGNGTKWIKLGTSESGREVHDEGTGFADTTRALTHSGAVRFRVPEPVKSTVVGGVSDVWVRARIIAGDYGRDPRLEKPPESGTRFASPLAPPCIRSATIDYNLKTSSQPAIVAYHDFTYSRFDWEAGPVPLFRPLAGDGVWCYLGFISQNGLPDRSMSVYVSIASPGREAAFVGGSGSQPVSEWQYWNGVTWHKWIVLDGTDGFTHSGILRFLAPTDFAPKQEFGRTMCWLRVRFREKTSYEPRIRRVVLNTTMASQAITLPAEILGTSKGTAGQRFTTTRCPILQGQQLEVREPIMPPARDRHLILTEEGADAMRPANPSEAPPGQVWIRWHEVPNFEISTAEDRHYTIDRTHGSVEFGDGVNGRIPPPLSLNIRMARYQIGGGASGNRKANTITELRSAINYIDSVTNVEPAGGGANEENDDALLRRAPRQIRHGWRAVTAQDYEDLAMLASPEVARARCLPTLDIWKESDAATWRPGAVSVIIASASIEAPLPGSQLNLTPSLELIERVRSYLDAHRPPDVDLLIAGPDYLLITVDTEVAIVSDASPGEVELAISLAIKSFLHPITGNRDGNGWQFGDEASRSDLFRIVEQIPGVDHASQLRLSWAESRAGARQRRQFLILPAEPKVTATLQP